MVQINLSPSGVCFHLYPRLFAGEALSNLQLCPSVLSTHPCQHLLITPHLIRLSGGGHLAHSQSCLFGPALLGVGPAPCWASEHSIRLFQWAAYFTPCHTAFPGFSQEPGAQGSSTRDTPSLYEGFVVQTPALQAGLPSQGPSSVYGSVSLFLHLTQPMKSLLEGTRALCSLSLMYSSKPTMCLEHVPPHLRIRLLRFQSQDSASALPHSGNALPCPGQSALQAQLSGVGY